MDSKFLMTEDRHMYTECTHAEKCGRAKPGSCENQVASRVKVSSKCDYYAPWNSMTFVRK